MKDPKSKYKSNRPLFPGLGIQISCPQCSKEIISSDINIDRALAKCQGCNNVFSFEENLKLPLRKRKEVFMPEEIEIEEYEDEMTIYYKWRKAKGLSPFLVFFGLFWNAMLIPFVIMALTTGNLIMLLGISIHLMVGIGFIITILTRLMNTTYINVDDYELSIEHRPINIPILHQNQYYDARAIKQLFAKKYVSHTSNNVPIHAYAVMAQMDNGEKIKIIKGLKSKTKALFIEQEIEIFLGIDDRKVDGEILS